jgi:hypothetical protein
MVDEDSKCHELVVEESVMAPSPVPKETSNKNVLASVVPSPMKDTPVPGGRINRFVPILIEQMSGS